MKLTRVLSFLTAAALCLGLAACQTAPEEVPASSAPAAASSAPATPTPAPTATPAPSPMDTPAATPVLTPGTDFSWLFANANPITEQIGKELEEADSFAAMRRAYGNAITYWENLITIAYADCMDVLPEGEQEQLKTEQEQWEREMAEKSETIYSEYPDDNEGILRAASELAGLYRDRAYDLCKMKFDADGVMPSFEKALEEPEPMG